MLGVLGSRQGAEVKTPCSEIGAPGTERSRVRGVRRRELGRQSRSIRKPLEQFSIHRGAVHSFVWGALELNVESVLCWRLRSKAGLVPALQGRCSAQAADGA